MQRILSDKNCERHARTILYAFLNLGYGDIVSIELSMFSDVGLPNNADDEEVWKFCQKNGYLLLTGNRRTVDGDASLELAARRLFTETSLPILTIGDLDRVLLDRKYCEQCATDLDQRGHLNRKLRFELFR